MTALGAKQPPKHRSFSQIKQYRTCGEQYRLERIDGAPSRPSTPAIAGVAVHSGTEEVDRLLGSVSWSSVTTLAEAGLAVAIKSLDDQVQKYTDQGWSPDEWRSFGRSTKQDEFWFRTEGIPNSLRAYAQWRVDNLAVFELADLPGFGPAIEVPFNYYIGAQLVHGFIDRVFTSPQDGGLYPFDLKSGLKPKTDEQLGLYGQALAAGLGVEITHGYFIHALKTGTAKLTAPINLAHWTTEKLERVYGPVTLAINAGIFIPAPGEACYLCSVSEHCEFSQAVI